MPAHRFHSHGPAMGPAALASPTATSRATKPDFRGGRASVMWLYKRNARWGNARGRGRRPRLAASAGAGAVAGPTMGQTGLVGSPGGHGRYRAKDAASRLMNR